MPISKKYLHSFIGQTAAIVFLAAGALGLHAQQSAGTGVPPIDLKSSLTAPLDLSTPDDLKYSSSTGSDELATAENFTIGNSEVQPPPRRRYGRPNYSDSHTNPDGSAKYSFYVGGGFTLPTGGTHNYAAPSWKIQVGGGRNFNKTYGVMLEFDYDNFGFQTSTLNNQLALYNNLCGSQCNFNQLGGTIHDWSFTLDPVANFYTSDTFGAYAIGGLGFYHKYTQFTTPTAGYCFDPYYGYYQCSANQPVDWYTSNALGLNGGLGLTYKASRFSSIKFYVEARYVWTDNKRRPYDVSGTTPYFNAFPQASAPTTYIPITFGVRF